MAEESESRILVMQFRVLSNNKTHSLKVPFPRTDLTGKEVKSVMDLIADNHYLWFYDELKPNKAQIVRTHTKMVDIAATD